jgi:hypothetical protein
MDVIIEICVKYPGGRPRMAVADIYIIQVQRRTCEVPVPVL